MNTWIGSGLALVALVMGGVLWGWQGVILALTVVVFWLLLQFSRLMRVMRMASSNPVGQVDSAVMLQSRLKAGLRMADLIPLTRSLGQKLSIEPETWAWTDAGGNRLEVVFEAGRCSRWTLVRGAAQAE